MTTQQTFEDLVGRVSVATEKLETAVTAVEGGTEEVAQAVVEAKQAATEAKGANTSAQLANTQAQQAKDSANTSAQTATTQAQVATDRANELKAMAPFQEAPKDGNTYGRKDGVWSVVTGGGGAGTVTSVNGKTPNATGEVTLTNTEVGAAATVHTHANATTTEAGFMSATDKTKLDGVQEGATAGADWNTNVANKPTIPTQGITSIQAGSNITIDNTNPLSPVISASGGGSSGGFPISEALYYDNGEITEWPSTNPNDAIDFAKVGAYITGRYKAGGELLVNKAGLNILPSGTYFFSSIETEVSNIVGAGIIVVANSSNTDKTVRVITYGNPTTLPQEYFPVIASNGDVTWGLKTDNPKFLHPQFENGWEYNFGTTGSPIWTPVDYWPIDSNHAMPMLSFRRRGSPYAGASSSLPSTGQDGLPISWNQMFSSAGYIQYVPPGKYWFTTTSFGNSIGGANLYNKTGYITVYGSSSGVGIKRAEAIAFDTTTNIPSVYYWKSDGTWNKAT